jgi:hypothetical protein
VKYRDPIIDDIRAHREEFARAHDYDVRRMLETLRQQQAASGRRTVTLPPRLVKRRTKKAS